jgi:hypothetical protein
MPNLSASDYTTFLKYKTAAISYTNGRPPRAIQTVDQAAPNINIINSVVKTSEASYRLTPTITSVSGLNYVRPTPPNKVNNPNALSRVSFQSGY